MLPVILFHAGISAVSGGYIGVDVFFVISGYLITTLIHKEIKEGTFTFKGFYKRRAARLLPALSITLFAVLIFGFMFYNNKAFDNLGKEVFFSSFGAANILFSQGINYFAKNEAYQPLIHLWSLGVEEQFYIVWPILLLLAYRLSNKTIIPIACSIFIVSLCLSVSAVDAGLTSAYFLLQYRAFELMVGVITALLLLGPIKYRFSDVARQVLSYIGLALILTPMFVLGKSSSFPGFNALWPCIGTALIIAFPNKGLITKLLSHKILVSIGLVSYPLYLFHQPVISFIYFFNINLSPIQTFTFVIAVSTLASSLTYKYIETPIRKMAHSKRHKMSLVATTGLVATIPFFAIVGIFIAKSGGLEERFKYLNPFALEISHAHSITFHENFKRGFNVTPSDHGSALFVGDSVLEHYVLPMKSALNLEDTQIDTVTRGGCVLLKGVDFKDKFSDISCNDIREKLYGSTKTYDYVIISQDWDSYDSSVMNFPKNIDRYERWLPLLNSTIEHFLTISDNVVIIGAHPYVDGTIKLQPSISITKDAFASYLKELKINNISDLKEYHAFFNRYKVNKSVYVIEPYKIFCNNECITNDGNWSYFSDYQHVSTAATNFITERLVDLIRKEDLTNAATRKN